MDLSEIPTKLTDGLLRGEEIITAVRQSRMKVPVNPAIVAITTQRMFIYEPKLGGLKYDLGEVYYRDLENVIYKKGLMMGTLRILYANGQVLEIGELENTDGLAVAREATQRIRDAFMGVGDAVGKVLTQRQQLEHSGSMGGPAVNVNVAGGGGAEDPLANLKLRLSKGEITVEEFKELSELLT